MTDKGGALRKWSAFMPLAAFLGVFAGHAAFLIHQASLPPDGWAEVGVGVGANFGMDTYIADGDHYMGFSYALGAGFAVWAFLKYLRVRQAALAAGAAGSLTLIGVLMGGGCFLVGCCGSPMLGVYAGLFGAKALGVGKPLMAGITVFSILVSYWYLSRRLAKSSCADSACACNSTRMRGPKS